VVVLDEYHVEQPEAVIVSSADPNRVFVEVAHGGHGLARVENDGPCAVRSRNVLRGPRGDAGHASQKIERGPFRLQDRGHFTVDFRYFHAGRDLLSVLEEDFMLE